MDAYTFWWQIIPTNVSILVKRLSLELNQAVGCIGVQSSAHLVMKFVVMNLH